MGGERGGRRGRAQRGAGAPAAPMGDRLPWPRRSPRVGQRGTRLPPSQQAPAPLSHRFPLVVLGGAGMYWDPAGLAPAHAGYVGLALGCAGTHGPSGGTYWDVQVQHWDVLESITPVLGLTGCTAPALGHTGTRGCCDGACWGPSPWHWDVLGATAPALGYAVIHGIYTGACWSLPLGHTGCTTPALELAGTCGLYTGACWCSSHRHWDTLRQLFPVLGPTGTHSLMMGTRWVLCAWCWVLPCPRRWDHQPRWLPWGLRSRRFKWLIAPTPAATAAAPR